MILDITLEHYIKLGGKLEKIDWLNNSYCIADDKNKYQKIKNCVKNGQINNFYDISFANGNTKSYHISKIMLEIEFVISNIYF